MHIALITGVDHPDAGYCKDLCDLVVVIILLRFLRYYIRCHEIFYGTQKFLFVYFSLFSNHLGVIFTSVPVVSWVVFLDDKRQRRSKIALPPHPARPAALRSVRSGRRRSATSHLG